MSTPINFAGPERYQLRELTLVNSAVCPPGRIMFWSGRKLLCTSDLSKLIFIPRGCDKAFLAAGDYAKVMGAR